MDLALAVGLLVALGFGVATAWIENSWAVLVLYAFVFLLGGLWAAMALFRPKRIRFNIPAALLWIAAAWAGVQLVFGATVNRWETMNATLLWSANAMVFLLALQLFSKRERREAFLRWLLYGGVALAVEAVFQLYTADGRIFWIFRPNELHGIIMGPVLYHNHFAALIVLVLPIGVYLACRSPQRLFTHGWMVGILAGAVFASQSRSGSILVGGELIVLLPIIWKDSLKRTNPLRAGLLLLFVIIGGAVAGWEGLWNRLHQGDSTRLIASQTSFEMTKSGPLTGYGLGTWPTVYPMFAHFDDGLIMNQGHDDWLQWAAEGGIGFLALLMCFGVAVSIRVFRSAWGLGVPAVLALCFIDFPLQKPAVSLVLFVLAGAVSVGAPPTADQVY
jgi:O-Antigen ligase